MAILLDILKNSFVWEELFSAVQDFFLSCFLFISHHAVCLAVVFEKRIHFEETCDDPILLGQMGFFDFKYNRGPYNRQSIWYIQLSCHCSLFCMFFNRFIRISCRMRAFLLPVPYYQDFPVSFSNERFIIAVRNVSLVMLYYLGEAFTQYPLRKSFNHAELWLCSLTMLHVVVFFVIFLKCNFLRYGCFSLNAHRSRLRGISFPVSVSLRHTI